MKHRNYNNRLKILLILFILLLLFVQQKREKSEIEANIDLSIKEMIENIHICEAYEEYYDRTEYTSDYQYYECKNKNHKNLHSREFYSIRNYGYYESEWYNLEKDIYLCPYSNQELYIEDCDWDHIIPLHYANQHGAFEWSNEKKKEFADDPRIGVNVYYGDNREKGDKGPSEWLPDNNVEDYCYTWLVIADIYNLSISEEDMDTIKSVLSGIDQNDLSLINEKF